MNISWLSIRRYRAFDHQVELSLHDLTVLTGPNNLGKSTVLTALDLFFSALQRRTPIRLLSGQRYSIETDYPKKYKGRAGRRWPTQIRVWFTLSSADKEELRSKNINGLSDEIEVSLEYKYEDRLELFRPVITVPGAEQAVATDFLSWLSENIRYVYIPATRNVQDLRRGVLRELISGALGRVSQSKKRIESIQRFYGDVLEEISKVESELAGELVQYLPSVKSLKFSVEDLDLENLVSVSDIEIDDGAKTLLQHKGDGFKSIFSISLLQYIARQRYGKNLIFGIEEPEAHLHSTAIYEIKSTLRRLAESYQVIVTTHSPILIQRDNLAANVLVEQSGGSEFSSNARAAKTLADIRRSLGIRPQENMTTAEVVIVVEGVTEERVLPSILGALDSSLGGALQSGRVRVLPAHGAQNILPVVRALARDATSCIVFLDCDSEGLEAAVKIRTSGLLRPADVFTVPARDGCRETEFEDLFDPALYLGEVTKAMGIALSEGEFSSFRQKSGSRFTKIEKWSKVLAKAANLQGKDWDSVGDAVKTAFANALCEKIATLDTEKFSWARGLSMQVSQYLREEEKVQ